jgi:hypothetical protein
MLKRATISLFFLTAIVVIISHDLIPHYHTNDHKVHVHEHVSQDKHGHDHEDAGEREDDQNGLAVAFSLFQHANSKGIELAVPENIQIPSYLPFSSDFIPASQFDLFLKKELPPLIVSEPYRPLLSQNAIPYFFALKAPPAV